MCVVPDKTHTHTHTHALICRDLWAAFACLALIKSGFIFRFFCPQGPLYELTAQLPKTHSHKEQSVFLKQLRFYREGNRTGEL